jgi:acetyl esterase
MPDKDKSMTSTTFDPKTKQAPSLMPKDKVVAEDVLNPADPFDPAAVPDDVNALNTEIIRRLSEFPDQWSFTPKILRERRAQGLGPFPLQPKVKYAKWQDIEVPGGSLRFRVIAPETGASRGIYLYFHAGGWMMGGADQQDPMLEAIANRTRLTAISVAYRLAPEHPYPAAMEDATTAALWAATMGQSAYGEKLVIAGDSCGAHLAVLALMRARDRFDLVPFSAAVLNAGFYDLALTPSARLWGGKKLVLNTRDLENYVKTFLPDYIDRRNPEVSPLYHHTRRMPPALFICGTQDPLLDDTLFLASRWESNHTLTEKIIAPGGCHNYQVFDNSLTRATQERIYAFLETVIDY